MNPYEPPPQLRSESKHGRRRTLVVWPLLLMNFAFLLCAILVVVLPGLGLWMLVSVLVIFSIGGWTLARALPEK